MPAPRNKLLLRVFRRVQEVRQEAGWTQVQVAERLGVSPGYYRRLEGAWHNITIVTLGELAGVMKVDVSTFFVPPKTLKARTGRPKGTTRRPHRPR